jgi:hypothetical protein
MKSNTPLWNFEGLEVNHQKRDFENSNLIKNAIDILGILLLKTQIQDPKIIILMSQIS